MVNMLLTTLLASLSFVAASPLPFAQQRNHTLEPRNPEQRDALTGVTTLHSKLPLGTNFCLDEDVPGGFVQLWECHAGVNQQWRLEKVSLDMDNFKAQSVTRFRVRRVDTDRCLHFVAPGESSLPSSSLPPSLPPSSSPSFPAVISPSPSSMQPRFSLRASPRLTDTQVRETTTTSRPNTFSPSRLRPATQQRGLHGKTRVCAPSSATGWTTTLRTGATMDSASRPLMPWSPA